MEFLIGLIAGFAIGMAVMVIRNNKRDTKKGGSIGGGSSSGEMKEQH